MDAPSKMEKVFSFPLSFAQQRLWFLNQISPGNPFYNIATAIPLKIPLRIDVLEKSINAIIQRHEALRTNFISENGDTIQIVQPNRYIDINVLSLQNLDVNERNEVTIQEYTRAATYSFNLRKDLLIRGKVLDFGSSDFLFILVMHHIISDGWSLRVFWEELIQIYNAFEIGQPNPLREIIIQYGDFAIWQREWLTDNLLEKQLTYWKTQLKGIKTLQLKTDKARPKVLSYNGNMEPVKISGNLTRALKTLSQSKGTTLFMTMFAAFSVMLHRYTQQNCIVIGTPVAGRNRLELEGLIGFFVNTLVLKLDLQPNYTFLQVMDMAKELILGAFAYQELPFEKLVEELQIERDLSRNPLFQVTFQLLSASSTQNGKETDDHQELKLERGAAIFDLALNLIDLGEEINGNFEYSTDLFEKETIVRMVANYKNLLFELVSAPQKRLFEYSILSKPEYQKIVVDWNQTEFPTEDSLFVHKAFEINASRNPSATAIADKNKKYSYESINRRANQLAHFLIKKGLGQELLVAICMDRSPEMIIAFLAVLKSGAAYVPLDPSYPKERLNSMIQEHRISYLITQPKYRKALQFEGVELFLLEVSGTAYEKENIENPEVTLFKENRAYVIFTSGSSGRPKGVEISHRSLINLVQWHLNVYDVKSSSVATQIANIAFDACVWEIWPYLVEGASLFIVDDELRLSPQGLIDMWKDQGIDYCFLPTPLAETVLAEPWLQEVKLKALLTGGDWLRQYPPASINFEILNHYGPTENAVVATFGLIDIDNNAEGLPPIGKPISNVQTYILNTNMQLVPIGVIGELFIGGASLARGYINRPDLTAERLLPNPFGENGSRLYKTGDMVRYLPDGNIEFLGRNDDQVKIRGFRIELSEIEICLLEHPEVKDVVVLLNKNDNQFDQLIACITTNKSKAPDKEVLRVFLKKRLPDYMLPEQFLVMESIPLTPNGKIDKKAILSSNSLTDFSEKKIEIPSNPVEKVIESIWAEILNLDQVGIHQNFFTEIGGHSLLATQIVSRLHSIFKIEIPLQTIFEAPTISEFAQAIITNPETRVKVEKIAEILISLEDLTDNEVDDMLNKNSPSEENPTTNE